MTFADSDQVKVGDLVLAAGSPFGLTGSVTMGIVSAIGRGGMGIVDYENFIQTDASINPGNSGGALVDIQGRLIGINTAIYSRSGGNQGIGFAVPSNLARNVMDSLLKYGSVHRGFLGAGLQELTPDLAQAFNAPVDQSGALIGKVYAEQRRAAGGAGAWGYHHRSEWQAGEGWPRTAIDHQRPAAGDAGQIDLPAHGQKPGRRGSPEAGALRQKRTAARTTPRSSRANRTRSMASPLAIWTIRRGRN